MTAPPSAMLRRVSRGAARRQAIYADVICRVTFCLTTVSTVATPILPWRGRLALKMFASHARRLKRFSLVMRIAPERCCLTLVAFPRETDGSVAHSIPQRRRCDDVARERGYER